LPGENYRVSEFKTQQSDYALFMDILHGQQYAISSENSPPQGDCVMKLSAGLELFFRKMDGEISPKTIRFYKDRMPSLIDYFNDIELDEITLDMLDDWKRNLRNRKLRYENHPTRPTIKGGLSPHTLHQYVRSCRRLFKWLTINKHLAANPAQYLTLPKLPKHVARGISKSKRDQLLEDAKGDPRDYAIIMVLSDTSARVGGIAGITLEDIEELDRGIVYVTEKGDATRPVFLLSDTIEAIQRYLKARPDIPECDYLWIGKPQGKHRNGKRGRLTESGIYQMLKRRAKRLKIKKGFNPHNFRHGSIKGMLDNGMPLPAASQIAGHSSTRVTGDIYGLYAEEYLKELHNRCSWLK
jgi:site-specific recombinase XerD